jgi:hypothetical protein
MFGEEHEEKIIPREGTIVQPRADGTAPTPPEGFTIYTTESGIMVLRRKRQRNLHKLGKYISYNNSQHCASGTICILEVEIIFKLNLKRFQDTHFS